MVSEQVATIIRSVRQYDRLELGEGTGLIEDLGFTSLDILNLILALEQRFQISVRDEDFDLERFMTFGAVLHTLRAYHVATV